VAGTDSPGDIPRGRITPGLFVFAAAGVCLGLSDVWRFPQLLVEHASPWFAVFYLAALLLVGVPLLVAELALARLGRSRPAANFGFVVPGTESSGLWQYVGLVVLIAVFLILSYATVVAGWMMAYTVRSLIGGLGEVSAGAARLMFQSLITDPERLLGWHTLFVVGLGWVAARDVAAGTGRFSRWLVVAVFALAMPLVGLSVYAYGIEPVFAVDWPSWRSMPSTGLVLDAVVQAFFTLGVCMGAMLILGHYLPSGAKPGPLVMGVVAVDILFVGLASVGVPPILATQESWGSGISFAMETMPLALSGLPLGGLWLGVFYALLFLLVATTALVLMELLVSWASEKTGKARPSVAPLAAAGVWVGGVLAILSFSALSFEFEFVGEQRSFGLFDVMDILSSQILLPIIGLLMAMFVGWNIDEKTLRTAIGEDRTVSMLHFLKRYLVPVAVTVIFVVLVFGRVLPRV